MAKHAGKLAIAMGAALILSALALFLHNRLEDRRAGEQAQAVLEELQGVMVTTPPTTQPEETIRETEQTQPTLPPDMPEVMLQGYAYIGTLSIPTLELELPVMAQWDYSRLRLAPCREQGSTRTGDLVIAAHNYDSHFGRLKLLHIGDTVTITEAEGMVFTYQVADRATLDPMDTQTVYESPYPLVLYTCTPGGETRVAVFCQEIP